jgi:hypothetical protein
MMVATNTVNGLRYHKNSGECKHGNTSVKHRGNHQNRTFYTAEKNNGQDDNSDEAIPKEEMLSFCRSSPSFNPS